ncbi:MAG: hypothetical protein ACTHN3_11390 [Solirubrobacterales bacterium]
MNWRPRCLAAALVAGSLALLMLLAQPSPPQARANPVCDIATGEVGAISEGVNTITGGLIGGGNPAGDACNAVSDAVTGTVTKPITDALKGVGNSIFQQITTWVAEGASWLIGQVVSAIEETTTPELTTRGFLAEYAQMAQIAALMGLAMLLLAVLEGLAQGNAGLLARVVLVNLPLAFIATSVAYAVVQLLLVATDGISHAIATASHDNSTHFFRSAITGLGEAGGTAGKEVGGVAGGPPGAVEGQAAGTVEVPLFVTFLAAIIGAFAAFMVWLELLMRDAAIYVVALFMPLALAASIWPRWSGALRRSGELLVVVIGSKFVIVSIISLAAGLVAESEGRVEHILAASALMLLACFAPFVLLKLVPFAEGAMTAAYGRRSAAGGAVSGIQIASDVQILRNMARSNWGESGATLWSAGEKGGGSPGPEPGGPAGGGGGPAAGGGGAGGGGGEATAGGAAGAGAAGAAAAVPAAAVQGTKASAQRLQGTAVAQEGTSSGAGAAAEPPAQTGGGGEPGEAEGGGAPRSGERAPRPAPEPPAAKPEAEQKQ